jgi:hypothetical protein
MSGATTPWHAVAIRLRRLLAVAGRRSDPLADVVKPVASSPPFEQSGTSSPETEDRERQLKDRERELRMLMAHWM